MLRQDRGQPAQAELRPAEKQIVYARSLASKTQIKLPWETLQSRKELSRWIEARVQDVHKRRVSDLPRSRQVAFAERLARIKGTVVPEDCFKSRTSMRLWLDRHAR